VSRELLEHPVIARIAAAWRDSMAHDRRVICTLAAIPTSAAILEWRDLTADSRAAIVKAIPHLARLSADFCAEFH
jgi:hypothetical protein